MFWKKNIIRACLSTMIYFAIGIRIMFSYPSTASNLYISNYLLLLFVYYIVGGFVLYKYLTNKIYIFEPFTLITFLYLSIFILRPIIDIKNEDMSIFGEDVSKGAIKATLIFAFS